MQLQTAPVTRATAPSTATTVTALTPRIDGVDAVVSLAPLTSAAQQEQRPVEPQVYTAAAGAFLEPGLQQGVAAAQQAQAWLDDLGSKLQGLKGSLAGLLIGGKQPNNTTEALRQFTAAWQQRGSQAGGMVDPQMRVVEPGQARQNFSLRGMDLANLTQEGPETLSFAVPGTPAAITVPIDPDQPPETSVQRLDQALAPAGMRVGIAAGKLQWSASESKWQALRDGLSVKGDGRRFPSGQRVRVRLDAQPEAIQPSTWSVAHAQDQRQTLGRVIAAQALIRDAGSELASKVAASRLPESGDAGRQGQVLLGFAQDFKAQAAQPVFTNFVALAPALKGVRRDQVRALLGA